MTIFKLAIMMIALSGCQKSTDLKTHNQPSDDASVVDEISVDVPVKADLSPTTPATEVRIGEPIIIDEVVPVPGPVFGPLLPGYASFPSLGGGGGKFHRKRCEKKCPGFVSSNTECSGFIKSESCDAFVTID